MPDKYLKRINGSIVVVDTDKVVDVVESGKYSKVYLSKNKFVLVRGSVLDVLEILKD
jgi:hypothetical protein